MEEQVITSIIDPKIQEGGNVEINDAVIAAVAFKEALDIEGVKQVEGRDAAEVLNQLRRGNIPKGFDIVKEEGEISFRMDISVGYGSNIPDVARQLRARISRAIAELIGLQVRNLDIQITGILPDE